MNKFNQSDELQQFYNELQEWIDKGCSEDHHIFDNNVGICSNFSDWRWYKNVNAHHYKSFKAQFKEAGLNMLFPFGESDYIARQDSETMYECPKRLKWIKEHSSKDHVQ